MDNVEMIKKSNFLSAQDKEKGGAQKNALPDRFGGWLYGLRDDVLMMQQTDA